MNFGVHLQWPRHKQKVQYVILIGAEIIPIAFLWWKYFWWSGLASIWFAGSLFLTFSLIYVNNSMVNWLNASKKQKPKDTLAERKAKHGVSPGRARRLR